MGKGLVIPDKTLQIVMVTKKTLTDETARILYFLNLKERKKLIGIGMASLALTSLLLHSLQMN